MQEPNSKAHRSFWQNAARHLGFTHNSTKVAILTLIALSLITPVVFLHLIAWFPCCTDLHFSPSCFADSSPKDNRCTAPSSGLPVLVAQHCVLAPLLLAAFFTAAGVSLLPPRSSVPPASFHAVSVSVLSSYRLHALPSVLHRFCQFTLLHRLVARCFAMCLHCRCITEERTFQFFVRSFLLLCSG